MGRPGLRDPGDVHVVGLHYNKQYRRRGVTAPVHIEEIGGEHRRCLTVQELPPGRAGAPFRCRGIFSALRTRRMVDAPTRWPSLSSSPWIRWHPQPWFSVASRPISAAFSALTGGRPIRCGQVCFRVTRRRCQRRTVPGVTRRCACSRAGRSRISAERIRRTCSRMSRRRPCPFVLGAAARPRGVYDSEPPKSSSGWATMLTAAPPQAAPPIIGTAHRRMRAARYGGQAAQCSKCARLHVVAGANRDGMDLAMPELYSSREILTAGGRLAYPDLRAPRALLRRWAASRVAYP